MSSEVTLFVDPTAGRGRGAVGGDGVVPLALQALAGTQVPLGVVAVGTGNDFARTLGLPVREPARAGRLAAGALKEGRIRDIDLGRADGTWYGTVLCSGFDSRVNDRGNRMRLPAGRFKYDLAMVAELAAFRPFPYRITLDGGGTHLGHPKVSVHRAVKVTLEAPGITAYADGEPLGPLPVTAECIPAAPRVLV
ncbi:diacylglycerol kinase family protein [Streptomyces xanthophaeus]|uniref:diacylglycerol kinase family protein n=1 Tax=Streptomyces xanthophaeus TaxID=67385 RepID=UPI0037151DEB